MSKVREVAICLALAGIPPLAACEPAPPPPTTPPPARITMHFMPFGGSPVSYTTYGEIEDVWIAGPDPEDPDVCHPVIVDDTLTFGEAPGPGNSSPVDVVIGGELLVEVDNRAECYRRDPDSDGWEQSIYSVWFDDYESLAGFDRLSVFVADIRAFAIVK